MQATYELRTKNSRFYLGDDGTVLFDFERNMGPFSGEWRIIGIGTRANSSCLVSLADAANGESIGQGWIHDIDHGTHRLWGMPTTRRAVSVTRLA